jgi:phosphodiesterase/alkaline phosphatase D-like protein
MKTVTMLTDRQFEASGLHPFTTYYYQFNVCNSTKVSPLGRTKTIPAKTQKVDRNINLAVYSCSNFRKSSLLPLFFPTLSTQY